MRRRRGEHPRTIAIHIFDRTRTLARRHKVAPPVEQIVRQINLRLAIHPCLSVIDADARARRHQHIFSTHRKPIRKANRARLAHPLHPAIAHVKHHQPRITRRNVELVAIYKHLHRTIARIHLLRQLRLTLRRKLHHQQPRLDRRDVELALMQRHINRVTRQRRHRPRDKLVSHSVEHPQVRPINEIAPLAIHGDRAEHRRREIGRIRRRVDRPTLLINHTLV